MVLLRFLQDQQFRPLGGKQVVQADVRIVAASNRTLEQLAEAGQFRTDLFYRLKLLHIELPPLRDRPGDVTCLRIISWISRAGDMANHASRLPHRRSNGSNAMPGRGTSRTENLVCRVFLLSEGPEISIPSPPSVRGLDRDSGEANSTLDYRLAKARAIEQFESRFLTQVIGCTKGNVSAAARLCGTERRHFGRLLKKYQIVPVSQQPARRSSRG